MTVGVEIFSASFIRWIIHGGHEINHEYSDFIGTTRAEGPPSILERVGLRIAVSDDLVKAATFENLELEVTDSRSQRQLATINASILLDPEYSESLEESEGLDPDPWVGFCRTVPTKCSMEQRPHSTVHCKLRHDQALMNALTEARMKAMEQRGDLLVSISPVLVFSPIEELSYDDLLTRTMENESLLLDMLWGLWRGPWSIDNLHGDEVRMNYDALSASMRRVSRSSIHRGHVNAFIIWAERLGIARRGEDNMSHVFSRSASGIRLAPPSSSAQESVCPTCDGQGYVPESYGPGSMVSKEVVRCPTCNS